MNGPKTALVPHQIPRKYATAPVSVSPSMRLEAREYEQQRVAGAAQCSKIDHRV